MTKNASLQIIWSAVMEECDEDGQMSLHSACKKQPSNIIMYLLHQNSSVLQKVNVYNTLPFHYICGWKEFICHAKIAVKWSEAIQTKRPHGNLPLHIAVCEGYLGVDTICMLLSWCPNAVYCCSNKRVTSITHCMQRKCYPECYFNCWSYIHGYRYFWKDSFWLYLIQKTSWLNETEEMLYTIIYKKSFEMY